MSCGRTYVLNKEKQSQKNEIWLEIKCTKNKQLNWKKNPRIIVVFCSMTNFRFHKPASALHSWVILSLLINKSCKNL